MWLAGILSFNIMLLFYLTGAEAHVRTAADAATASLEGWRDRFDPDEAMRAAAREVLGELVAGLAPGRTRSAPPRALRDDDESSLRFPPHRSPRCCVPHWNCPPAPER